MQPVAPAFCGRESGYVSINARLQRLQALWALPLCPLLALFSLWVVCNPFFAIDASSLIYSARTLADLDPQGVGQDVMFRFDGQSNFTVFTGLMRELASMVGLAPATMAVAVGSVLAGFLGAAVFAWSATTGRTRYLVVVFAATLPTYYGGYQLFCYAEVAATPRPFAEALVLAALAALLHRRTILAIVLIGLATLCHPIMALGGLGVVFLWLAIEDRRWLILIPVLACLVMLAAGVGIRPFDRLWTVIDPDWKAILIDRNPHLFPHLWPSGWIGRTSARVASLVIAAGLVHAPVRRLFLSALLVGAVGFAMAYVLNERFEFMIVLQAQTWRTMWLVFALGAFAAAICVAELWPRGGTARLTLAFLALSWAFADQDVVASLCGAVAVGVHYALDPADYRQHRRLVGSIVLVLSSLVIVGLVQVQLANYAAVSSATTGLIGEARRTLALSDDYTPIAIVAAIVILVVWPRVGPASMRVATASLCVLALAVGWDQRSIMTHYFDSGRGTDDLARLVASKPGDIYWLNGGRETWWWLHRPQWLSAIQGASIVFSRDLGLIYKERAQRAMDAGLADDNIMTPISAPVPTKIPVLDPKKLAVFCAASDAPAWIVAPLLATDAFPTNLGATEWIAPVAKLERIERDGTDVWMQLSRYAVLPCR